jgi:hypothetical protein
MLPRTRRSRATKISWPFALGLALVLFIVTGCDRPAAEPTGSTSPSGANNTNATGPLRAEPNPVPASDGAGNTTINWQTSDGTIGEVYVSMDGASETLFARGSSGPATAPWIAANSTYEFRLYQGTDHKTLLGRVIVTRAKK